MMNEQMREKWHLTLQNESAELETIPGQRQSCEQRKRKFKASLGNGNQCGLTGL